MNGTVLTAKATIDLVTTRTLTRALALLGIDWSPVPFDETMTSEKGLYSWVIGRGYQRIDLLDRPVAYVGIGDGDAGGLYRRLSNETSWIEEYAAHAHGRAMYRLRLDGSALGGPVRRTSADISWIDTTIRDSDFKRKERGIQELRAWLAGPNLVEIAEQLCIRAAVHIGDTPPPLNSQHANAWASDAPCDWGGWAVAQRLATGTSVKRQQSQ